MKVSSDVLCKRLEELADADLVLLQASKRIQELEAENVRLNKRYDILAMHMAEVKAMAANALNKYWSNRDE